MQREWFWHNIEAPLHVVGYIQRNNWLPSIFIELDSKVKYTRLFIFYFFIVR